MICPRCKRNNPDNVNHCIYCGAGLRKNVAQKASKYVAKGHGGKKKNSSTNKFIIAAIAALLVLLLVIAAFAVNSYTGYSTKRGFGHSGGGGGGSSSASSTVVQPSDNSNISVTLDGDDPDVEIYSFDTDTYDILIGETKTVTFTAEIFTNVELNDTDVSVVASSGTLLGYMNDAGIDGDATADDGVYTLQKEMSSQTVQNTLYYAKAKDIISDSINLCFYRVFTDEDFGIAEDIAAELREISAPFLNEDSTIDNDRLSEALQAIESYLENKKRGGIVLKYTVNDNSVRITLAEGYMFDYDIQISGTSASGDDGCILVASYAPFDSLRGDMEELYDAALDGTSQNIDDTFSIYKFNSSGDYNLNSVTLDNLKNLSDYGVVLWGGHGGYDKSDGGYGSIIMTGQLVNSATSSTYSADITSDKIFVKYSAEGRNTYAVSGGFFSKYLDDMQGAFVYLSACYSGKDMVDGKKHKYRLAQSFINKGASVVIGNSESIGSEYTYKMQRDIVNRMCENDGNEYYTVSEALEYAKDNNGDYDGFFRRARPIIFPQTANAGNYKFDSLKKGYVAGNVKYAEDGNSVTNALVRVYKNNDVVSKVRTDSNGYYNIKLSEGDYIIKITKGHYKSAKIAVTITENSTVYNETFLLMDVGVNSGYANGTITDAVSGEEVGGVAIQMRSSWNNKDGNVILTTATNDNGYYEISYNPGFYTLEYSKDGYITGYKNIIIGIVDFSAQNAAISPEMPDDGNFRIVLSWSEKPNDLDSHLTGPTADGGRFHLYYVYADSRGRNENTDYYRLDLDNTNIVRQPNIPETTTIVTQLDGVYRYSVHDFSNGSNASSSDLSESNATVNVYKGSVLVATYHVPPNVNGTIWTVFELSGNTITPINKIGSGSSDDASKF